MQELIRLVTVRSFSVNFIIIISKFGDAVHDLLDRAVNGPGPYADCTIWRKPNQVHAVHFL
jgi:hypothetical protein